MSTSLLAIVSATGALVLGGLVLAPAGAATAITHEASLEDGAYATVRVATGSELAGESMSVLILAEGVDPSAPSAGDIVYVDQRVLDDDGALTFRAKLPSAELDGYYLAVGATGGTERYLAPLDGEEDPTQGPTDPDEEPTEAPADPTAEPTDPGLEPTHPGVTPTDPGSTDEPTDGGTDGADGGAGGGTADDDGGPVGDDDGDDVGRGPDRLSETGAPAGLAAGVALGVVAIGAGAVALVRARTARASSGMRTR